MPPVNLAAQAMQSESSLFRQRFGLTAGAFASAILVTNRALAVTLTLLPVGDPGNAVDPRPQPLQKSQQIILEWSKPTEGLVADTPKSIYR